MELNKENLESFQAKVNVLNALKQELKNAKDDFDMENKALIENIEIRFAEMDSYKSGLKERALVDFQETGNKKLLGGIGIREGTSLRYDDILAFNWAKKHDLCLQLDKKEFEKLAKTQDINGVIKEDKITVTFPKEIKL